MATKYVRETKAGKSLSAYVILNPEGEHVADVQAHFSDGGTCLVNVFNFGKNKDAGTGYFQHGKAGGYGYDKFTAALSGLTVDGIKMVDNSTKGEEGQPDVKGANYRDGQYTSWHIQPGLQRLEALGYKVIQAL